jgi:hypothetical protein
MKTKVWLPCIAAVILFGLVGWTGFGQKPQRTPLTTWEYKVVYIPGARNLSEGALNKMGAEGWELITFQAINNEGGTMGAGNYFFKRARTNQP